jgi:signal transduction histidine kinase
MTDEPRSVQTDLDFRALLDGMGQGVLLFDSEDRLVLDNLAARAILGTNLMLMRTEGWSACAMLLDARRIDGPSVDDIRRQALKQTEPIRFHTLLAGAYTPCWMAAIYGANRKVYTMVSIDRPDWRALSELMSTFREEAGQAVDGTRGHAELIMKLLRNPVGKMSVDQIRERIAGFAEIMVTHMYRLQLLMDLLQRLEIIRTDRLSTDIKKMRRKLRLDEFVEDMLEEMNDEAQLDPTRKEDIRERLTINIPGGLDVAASPKHLSIIIRDVLRNAAMYSPKGSPITIKASRVQRGKAVQLDIMDQGCGIRIREADRVFAPFQRARQPQVIAEFGYGLSLYLAKAEIEAMSGRIWYESEENVGTTFSIKLPMWVDASDDDD